MKRSIQTTIAAILNALFSLVNIVMAVPFLAQGAEAVNAQAGVENPPYFILVMVIILGVVGLVATWGLWKNQKWAKIVVIVIQAMGGLSALPGVIFADNFALRMSAILGVAIPIIVIVLLLWRSPQSSTVAATD